VVEVVTLQTNATAAQMKTYNALARKYSAMSKENRIVKHEDLVTMEYIYGIMSKSQKAKAEPFPDSIPPPPPPPIKEAPSVPKVKGQLVEIIEVEPSILPSVIVVDRISSPKIASKVIDLIEIAPGNIVLSPSTETTVRVVELTNAELAYVITPTGQPTKIATTVIRESNGKFVKLDVIDNQEYLKMMDSKKAIFYFEGKKINIKKAIKVVKSDPNIYIRTLDHDSDQPIIKLEKSRIIIDRQ